MRRKWLVWIFTALAVAALFLPAVNLHVHSQHGADTAALFPESLSLLRIMFEGTRALPLEAVPALGTVHFGSLYLIAGMVLLLSAAVLSLFRRRGIPQLTVLLSVLSLILLATGILQWMNLCGSLLFSMLFTSAVWLFVPLAASVALTIIYVVSLKGAEPLCTNDRSLRLVSALLALLAVLSLLLPVWRVTVPDTFTADPADAQAARRSVSLLSATLGSPDNLTAEAKQKQVYSKVISGDMAQLITFSGDANNVSGIFQIRSGSTPLNGALLTACILLVLGILLSLIRKVDRWFPLALLAAAALMLVMETLSVMTVSADDIYAGAPRQLLYLGVGTVTPALFLTALLAAGAAITAALGVRYANEPYFNNPLPAGMRIRFVAVCLTVLAIACMLLPTASFTFTKPGKNKAQAVLTVSGWDMVTGAAADRLANPADSKGKAVYPETAEEYSAEQVNQATASAAGRLSVLTWAALVLAAAALVLILLKKNRRLIMALLLASLAFRLAAWFTLSLGIPRAVATVSGMLYLYASLPLLLFAAFFTNFAHLEELPKKYKLFLMILPFLLAVFLFSYLPLYGWSYAFYNYKFGIPMDQQEFVGFKWFAEMFTNPANQDNIGRVLKNTLGMSGLNLLTSWLPMVFAIFLNEITRTKFKKFVQIFTTLPNFISWALVFSFAMCLFAADTGIYSKLMIELGLNDPANPTVWLNSSQHIWLKMWGWSTWKGLGWGAIMYLAAISGIDQELYEAAKVDGANRWALMRHITLPGLLPTFFVLFMLSISNILNNGMEQYLVFQNPLNRQTIEVLDLYVYNITIASGGTALYSYATAIGILKTLVSVTLLFTANFLSKKLRGESIM